MTRLLYIALAATLLAACSSAPTPRPATEEGAIQWSQRGEDAYRRGDLNGALAAYEQAFKLYASVEHNEGSASQLLNIATVYYRLGDRARASQTLDQILTARGVATPARFKAEAAYRRAYFDFESGDMAGANSWLGRAQEYCVEAACDVGGRLSNLKAQLALARDDIASAELEARRGAELNRRGADAVEEANSLRLLAEIAVRRGQHAAALAFYEQALTLDKNAAEPRKIVLDLLGASRSLAAQGKSAAAGDYAERARRVAESVGDEQGQQQAAALLKSLSR